MNRFIRSMLVVVTAATALLSCSRDGSTPQEADTIQATFRISNPKGADTKAISDGLSATKLLLYAYDANGTYLPALKVEKEGAFNTRIATATLTLVKGMTYSFVFVAMDPAAAGAYSVNPDDGTLKVDYAALTANDDAYDLFTTSLLNYTVTGDFNENITLTRPFAQVNVGIPPTDFVVATNSGILGDEITSSLGFSQVGMVYDLRNKEVTANSEGESVDIPAGLRPVNENLVTGENTYKYMAMAYVLVPMDGVTADNRATIGTVQVSLGVKTVSGATSTLVRTVPNVPVQKNYRTNIVGTVFGVTGTFNIIVDQNFQGDINGGDEPGDDPAPGNADTVPIEDWGIIN